MKRLKQILAIIGIVVIAGLYIVTFICAIFVRQISGTLFLGSVVATLMIPLLLYLVFWLCHLFQPKERPEKISMEEKTRKGFAEAAAFNKREKKSDEDMEKDGNTGL